MLNKTKIEWCDLKTFASPMSKMMATITSSNNIKKMAAVVSKMVMIFHSWLTTVETWQTRGRGKNTSLDSGSNSIGSSLSDIIGRSQIVALFVNFHTTARKTSGTKSITSGFIQPEHFSWLPLVTMGTPFKTFVQFTKIFLITQTSFLCGYFCDTNSRTHTPTLIECLT